MSDAGDQNRFFSFAAMSASVLQEGLIMIFLHINFYSYYKGCSNIPKIMSMCSTGIQSFPGRILTIHRFSRTHTSDSSPHLSCNCIVPVIYVSVYIHIYIYYICSLFYILYSCKYFYKTCVYIKLGDTQIKENGA